MKWSKIATQQQKTIENLYIINIKSVFIEHPKTSCWKGWTVSKGFPSGSNKLLLPLYSEMTVATTTKHFLTKKTAKLWK